MRWKGSSANYFYTFRQQNKINIYQENSSEKTLATCSVGKLTAWWQMKMTSQIRMPVKLGCRCVSPAKATSASFGMVSQPSSPRLLWGAYSN